MTPASAARLLATVPTVREALSASERAREAGQYDLADGLWCHASMMRSFGYPEAHRTYLEARDGYLAAAPEPEVTP